MNQKKTLSHIVDLLVAKYDMNRDDATTFVRGIFELIEEALVTEKFVKVKGLGTFKLTEVESRESVDVRTGERIEIQEHNKISFIPETALKELINKPFSHFENVLLNEDTVLPDTEVFVENSPAEEDVTSTLPPVTDVTPDTEGHVTENTPEEESLEALSPESESPVPVEKEVSEIPVSIETVESENPVSIGTVESEPIVAETPETVAPEPVNDSETDVTPETETAPEADVTPEAETAPSSESTLEVGTISSSESTPEPGTTPEAETTPEADGTPKSETTSEPDSAPEPETAVLADQPVPESTRPAKKSDGRKMVMGLIVLVLLFVLGAGIAYLLMQSSEDETMPVEAESTELNEEAVPVEPVDSLAADSLQQSAPDAVPTVEEKPAPAVPVATGVEKVAPAGQEAAPAAPASRDAYRIVGTKTTHTVQSGETLRIIAEKYYGNRNLSKYIVKHNAASIPNPDMVPAGTQLNIPELQLNN